MNPGHETWVLVVGVVVVLAAAVHAVAHRACIPSMVGYLALGLGLRAVEDRWQLLGEVGTLDFGLLADLGVVVLPFHVGLRSDLAGLARKLRPAALIWLGGVSVAAGLGYGAARHLAGLDVVASLIVAVALFLAKFAAFAAAVVGKLASHGVPALAVVGPTGAALIAASMLPRAEIAMVVAQQGRAAGLLPEGAQAALVFVSAATCLATPWLVHALLRRWPQSAGNQIDERRR